MPKNDTELLRMLRAGEKNPHVWSMVHRSLRGILDALCGTTYELVDLAIHMPGTLPEREKVLRKELLRAVPDLDQQLKNRMRERSEDTFEKIKPYINEDGDSLDLGCGSGEIAAQLFEHLNVGSVICADVRDWRKEAQHLDFYTVENNHIQDAKNHEFDHVVMLMVAHHSDDPEALVAEAFRVGTAVTIIESVTNNMFEYMYGTWIDWFYNRIVHYAADPGKKISVPARFLPAVGWEQMIFRITGRLPSVSQPLGIFQLLNPENHHLLHYAAE